VLESLQTVVDSPDTDFKLLELPLKQCGKACHEFETLIREFAPEGNEDRRTFRGWVRMKYRGEDIKIFKESLGVYRSIVCIAIGDANLWVLLLMDAVMAWQVADIYIAAVQMLSWLRFSRNTSR
jgi:hypothetical protein